MPRPTNCRWILNEDVIASMARREPIERCSNPRLDGKPYCAHHDERAHVRDGRYGQRRPRKPGVVHFIAARVRAGDDNATILAAVRDRFPWSKAEGRHVNQVRREVEQGGALNRWATPRSAPSRIIRRKVDQT